VRATSDSHFSWIRTRLSVERTLTSWLRTAVSLIGFGFTIVQFFERLHDTKGVAQAARPEAPRYIGLALIGAGVLVLVISAFQYRRMVRYLWSAPFQPLAGVHAESMKPVILQTPVMTVTIIMILIGVFAFGAVMLRVL
jgi:putative membrane protein